MQYPFVGSIRKANCIAVEDKTDLADSAIEKNFSLSTML